MLFAFFRGAFLREFSLKESARRRSASNAVASAEDRGIAPAERRSRKTPKVDEDRTSALCCCPLPRRSFVRRPRQSEGSELSKRRECCSHNQANSSFANALCFSLCFASFLRASRVTERARIPTLSTRHSQHSSTQSERQQSSKAPSNPFRSSPSDCSPPVVDDSFFPLRPPFFSSRS